MTYDEMNKFILNYVKNDRTGRAIMLTGEWGSGKSYYILETLKPFLEDKKNGKYKCVIVSLYGLKELSDISKSIYTELRFLGKKKQSEASATAVVAGKIVCKTILNAVASYKGFDIAQNDDDFVKVYESIDLKNKLIVLEDLERSGIDLIQLLGYVNNLTEQDGVKVLLVANEDEIIKNRKNDIFTPNDEEKREDDTDLFIEQYKRIREKTIGDTICFMYDPTATVTSIINKFTSTDFNYFHNEEEIQDVCDLLSLKNINNFRTLIFACQKTEDVFKFCSNNNVTMDEQFKKSVFYGLIILSDSLAKGGLGKWDSDKYLSSKWGIKSFPVFRFCYDYLQNQILDVKFIRETIFDYRGYLKYSTEAAIKDEDVDVIHSYYLHTPDKVKASLERVYEKLQKKNTLSLYEYGRLMYSVFSISENLKGNFNIDVQKYKEGICNNLKGLGEKINIDYMFRDADLEYFFNPKVDGQMEKFHQEIEQALFKTQSTDFSYEPDKLLDYLNENNISWEEFISNIDVEKFIALLERCSAENLSKLERIFIERYSIPNEFYGSFEDEEKTYDGPPLKVTLDEMNKIQEISEKIIPLIGKSDDCIINLQRKWFYEILDIIITFSE